MQTTFTQSWYEVRTILVLADLQIPFHDKRYVSVMEKFIAKTKPDEVGQIGDFLDQPEPSRWNKGRAGEYEPTLQKSINTGMDLIKRLGIQWIKMGNHDERIEAYVDRYAPALGSLDCLRYEQLLHLGELGVSLHRKPFQLAPGWLAAHGHEGSLSGISGRTAFSLALQFDQSVICGHTHRAGVVSKRLGYHPRFRSLAGVEVGHGMDITRAGYIKGTANWQKGFALVYTEGKSTQVELVTMTDSCQFIWRGEKWMP